MCLLLSHMSSNIISFSKNYHLDDAAIIKNISNDKYDAVS